jgi:rare lipoprotein A
LLNQSPYSRLTTGLYSVLLLAALACSVYSLGRNVRTAEAADETPSAFSGDSASEDPSDSKGESIIPSEDSMVKPEEVKPEKPLSVTPAIISIPIRDDEAGFQEYRATAYCLRGPTAMGHPAKVGMIAADPRVLPLGTMVHIRAGSYTGVYKVVDTGGRMRGRIVDIFVSNRNEALKFGRRPIKLKVIGRGNSQNIEAVKQ